MMTSPATERKSILIVDDVETNRVALAAAFTSEYAIEEAQDGRAALALLQKKTDYVVIILDLVMPEMDGFELLRRLKSDPAVAEIPVVVNTMHGDDENELAALRLGAEDFIFKPYNPELIRHRVDNVVARRRERENDKKMARLQAEKEALSRLVGGQLGSYYEPGFPLYTVNETMLGYLGYADEADLAAACGGSVQNLIHPQDREPVWQSIEAQLRTTGEYIVEYRMQKKDGSYLWLHEAGRKIEAKNGRPVLASICFDITAQRELQQKLEKTTRICRPLWTIFRVVSSGYKSGATGFARCISVTPSAPCWRTRGKI